MPEQTGVANECFISSELKGRIGDSVCVRYCWFCSTEQAYHLWKHWRLTGSVQIINMHGNQYISGSGGEKNWEKHRKSTEALECSSSFITVIYSLSLSSLCCTCAHTHCPHTQAKAHICMHSKRERDRERICPDQQIIHSFLSDCPCGAVHCVIASALLWWLASVYICHLMTIRGVREQSETKVCSSIDLSCIFYGQHSRWNTTQTSY